MRWLNKAEIVVGFVVLVCVLGCQAKDDFRTFDTVKYEVKQSVKKERFRSRILDSQADSGSQSALSQLEKLQYNKPKQSGF